jgi:hypothetical protein
MDIGTAAAVKEAGLTGKVYLATSGGGEQKGACDMVKGGGFDYDISYDVPTQASNMAAMIRVAGAKRPQGRPGAPEHLHHADPDHQGQRLGGRHLLEAGGQVRATRPAGRAPPRRAPSCPAFLSSSQGWNPS